MGKRGPRSAFDDAKFEGRRTQDREEVFEANSDKSKAAFQAYLGGFRLWWRCCPAYLLSIGVKPEGSYGKKNHTGGKMFSLPGDINLTERQASRILWKCYKSRDPWLTIDQIKLVMKTLSFSYQVQGGTDTKTQQWAKVLRTWKHCTVQTQLCALVVSMVLRFLKIFVFLTVR